MWPILVAILLFGLVVFIHELGHFMWAKLMKVKVNEFSLGFGPAILKFTKGETLYAVRLLPLGGYCAMEGEDEESTSDRAFHKKPVWKRFIIIVAGAVHNLILGLILVGCLLATQGVYGTTTVADFNEEATSSASGLQAGDEIVKINGRSIYCSTDISYMLLNNEGNTVDMVVKRGGEKVNLDAVSFPSQTIEGKSYIDLDFRVVGQKVTIRKPLSFLKEAVLESVSIGRMVWMSLFDMITGRYGLNEMMGPVGVIDTVGQAVSMGMDQVLYIMALITINLGIVNLLPLPALDGGRLVFLIVEGIRRKPIPQKYEGWIHAIGLAMLLLLILVITGSDIWRLIRRN